MRPQEALDIYLSDYKNGHGGLHDLLSVFLRIQEGFDCKRVLYPGSYLHVTPSLVFPEVCYVDSLKDICKALANRALLEYIKSHKNYSEDSRIRCYQEDYYGFDSEPEVSFDLLISLNAGFISQACKRLLRSGGLLLVNDGHHDASRAYVDPNYQFLGAFEGEKLHLETSEQKLSAYFKTTKFEPLTLEMVEVKVGRSASKTRFKLAVEAEAYLFQRTPEMVHA